MNHLYDADEVPDIDLNAHLDEYLDDSGEIPDEFYHLYSSEDIGSFHEETPDPKGYLG